MTLPASCLHLFTIHSRGQAGCATGTQTWDPQNPPYLCRARSALFPTSTTGTLQAQGGSGPRPGRDSTHPVLPQLSYSSLWRVLITSKLWGQGDIQPLLPPEGSPRPR